MNIGGVFLVIAIGTGMSLVAFVVEYYIYKIKPQRDSRLYDIRRKHASKVKQNGVNVNDMQIDLSLQNGGSHITKNELHAETNNKTKHTNNARMRNGSCIKHKQNGVISNTSNHYHHGEINVDKNDNHTQINGHVQNGGIDNTFFTFDTDDTIEERYPSIRQQEETQKVEISQL